MVIHSNIIINLWDLIKPRLLPSFEMGLTAMFIGVILGLILGVAAATKQNSWVDYTTTVISVIAVSVPSFVLAVLYNMYLQLN